MSSRPAAGASRPRGEFFPGDRVLTGGRRGVVHFQGLVHFATGKYVGIELDLPEGKHDGSMKGERYFSCQPNHGVFVKPSMVQLDTDAPPTASPTPAPAPAAAELTPVAAPAPTPVPVISAVVTPVASKPVSRVPSRRSSLEDASVSEESSGDFSTPRKSLAQALENKQALRESATSSPSMSAAATTPPKSTFALPPLAAVRTPTNPALTASAPLASTPAAPVTIASILSPGSSSVTASSADQVRLQSSFDALQTAHSKLGQDFKQLQVSMTKLQAEKSLVADEAARVSQELSARDRQLAELRTELSESQSGGAALESLQNMVEMLTIDKALAEEQYESSVAELAHVRNEYANQELELQLLREQHAVLQHAQAQAQHVAASSGGGTLITSEHLSASEQGGAANQKLLEQNALLTDALRKLRDLNLAEKQAATTRIAELERTNATLAQAEAENAKLREATTVASTSIASLKEQLDEALELQSMVESLSQAKMDLEESAKSSERTIAYLQSLVTASEEVEEGYKDLQSQLQSELETKEYNFVDLNQRYKLKNVQIDDLQATNRKFRELVRQLENENQTLKSRAVDGDSSAVVAAGGQQVVLAPLSGLAATRSSSLLTLRLKQVRTAHLDKLLALVDRDLLEKRVQFLALYIPSNITTDDRSLAFLQLLERIKQKSSVLASVWARFYGALGGAAEEQSSAKVAVDYAANGTSPEMALLAYNACLLLASIVHATESLTAALYTIDVETYNALCIRSVGELSPLENILDSYLTMISLDTLNELTSLQSLVQANWILYAFLVEKVPLHALVASAPPGTETDEFNIMPYQMALWTVVKKSDGEAKWNELLHTYRERAAATKRPELPTATAALLPSSVPSLGTFALTLSYATSLAQTYAQLVADQLNALTDALLQGRAKKRGESESERQRRERADAIGSDSPSPVPVSNASLSEYTSPAEDADIAIFLNLWSDIADATLNNLSLANQLHQTSTRNYTNAVGSGKEEGRAKQEASLRQLLPHMHAIDALAQTSALQLAALLQSLRPLLQVESLTEFSSNISEVAPEEGEPSHPALLQVVALLQSAKSSTTAGQTSLLASLTQLRSELYTTSKKVLLLIEESAQSASDPDSVAHQTTKARHQRTTSFALVTPQAAGQATSGAGDASSASPDALSALQPWYHHPLTIRSQLSASASLRTSLQDLSTRLSEKQKEVYLAQKCVSEEKAKQDVLHQQLAFHTTKASQHSEFATMNENLKAQVEESHKQINLTKMEMDKLARENRAVRKQMLKLKSQYLKEEQTRAQIAQAQGAGGVASGLLATGGSVIASSVSSAGITSLAALSSANLSELMAEVDLLRRTLAAQREELATWKTKQTLREMQTMLPDLHVEPTSKPHTTTALNRPVYMPLPPVVALPSSIATVDPRSNPLLASMPPALSFGSSQVEDQQAEARFLRAKLTEVAQHVWTQRTAPRVVKLLHRPLEEESKRKEDSETDEKTPTSKPKLPSPYQQYIDHRVQAVHVQQCCDKLNQRVNAMADQQRLRQWTAVV